MNEDGRRPVLLLLSIKVAVVDDGGGGGASFCHLLLAFVEVVLAVFPQGGQGRLPVPAALHPASLYPAPAQPAFHLDGDVSRPLIVLALFSDVGVGRGEERVALGPLRFERLVVEAQHHPIGKR